MLSVGDMLSNYEITGWLGRGAFADVYEARHVVMDRQVALKVVLCDQSPSEKQFSEARLWATLSHPNIIQLYDCGFCTDSMSGRSCLYLALELARGGTLRARLQSLGQLSQEEAADLVVSVCEALSHAHARGVVHRDVKPENVLLTDEGVPKLTDFGVSRLLQHGAAASTVVGTPRYMAPEGWAGATRQSDIWSVGVMLYEMLSGAPPFRGDTPAELEQCVQTASHTCLSAVAPGVPAPIVAAVDRALQKDPADRFATAQELASVVRPYASTLSREKVSQPTGEAPEKHDAAPVKGRPAAFTGSLSRGLRTAVHWAFGVAVLLFLLSPMALIIVPRALGAGRKAKEATLRGDLHQLRNSIQQFETDCGDYPADLSQLMERPAAGTKGGRGIKLGLDGWQGPYLRTPNGALPADPFTSSASWVYDPNTGEVHSGSTLTAINGGSYSSW